MSKITMTNTEIEREIEQLRDRFNRRLFLVRKKIAGQLETIETPEFLAGQENALIGAIVLTEDLLETI